MLRLNFSRFAVLVGLAAVFSSCNKSVVVDGGGGVKSHVTVDVRTFALASEGFGAYGSSSDVGTKGEDSYSPASRLSFAVFDAEGALVGEVINKVSSADGFGLVEMDLYPGVYSLVAVAHGGAADAVIASSSSVVLPGSLLTDTFAKVQSLTRLRLC